MKIQVENIKCNGCAASIKNGLLKFPEIKNVAVEIESGTILIEGEDDILNRDVIIEKLQSMGYPQPGSGSALTTATSYVSCMIGRVTS